MGIFNFYNKQIYIEFPIIWTRWSFATNIFIGKMNWNNVDEDQSYLLTKIVEFKNPNTNPKDLKKRKQKKTNTLENFNALYKRRQMDLNAFKTGIISIPPTESMGF